MRFAFLIAAALIANDQARAGIVVNGGFETGDFTGWDTSSGFTSMVDDGSATGLSPHTGTYFAALWDQPPGESLSQTIATAAGTRYSFSFWLGLHSGGKTPSYSFQANWDGGVLLSMNSATDASKADFDYRQFSYTVTATSASTTISFTNVNVPFSWTLDDVDVTALPVTTVPEIGTIGSAAVGGLLGLAALRRRRS